MSGDDASGLFDRPVLALDPGFHTAMIKGADVDAAGRIAVTGSEDRTVRVWSLVDGTLKRTIRLPQGPGNIGKVYAVAISPDGELIAVGGWTRWSESDPQQQIYILSATSGMVQDRIEGLPNVANDLAFSPDGGRLAATVGTSLRLYERDAAGRWAQSVTDDDYRDTSLRVAFNTDGSRLATTSRDGKLRLYDADGHLLKRIPMLNAQPLGLAFNPVDGRLAVGFSEGPAVVIFDSETLTPSLLPDIRGIDDVLLGTVAWSVDGEILFAAGMYAGGHRGPVLAWEGGAGAHRLLIDRDNTVMSLRPLSDGALLVASAEPWLGMLEADGAPRWSQPPRQFDPRHQCTSLEVSSDGMVVEFGLRYEGADRRRFDLSSLQLTSPVEDGRVLPPRQGSLDVEGWKDRRAPRLNGTQLPLEREEMSRSLAVHRDGDQFLIGTEWWLRAFDRSGAALWPPRPVPGAAWAVNICGNGRLAIVAYDDGTLRWHCMEDGAELLALFPLPDGENWVAWTPEGIYAATPLARSILRWHVNRGWDRSPEAISVSDIPETFRPEVIRQVLPQMGTLGVIGALGLEKVRNAVRRVTGADVPPGARLHVLAIGISDYGEAARHLELSYADRDARQIAEALVRTQVVLYPEVRATCLVNEEATTIAIFAALEAIRNGMNTGGGGDLAVIHYSGHGDMVDDKFYLLPHGTDDSSKAAIKATGLDAGRFRDEAAAIAKHGRVILLVDACRSGGATSILDRSLRAMLTEANVTVLTSCAEKQLSQESMAWENGAFTEALLEALGGADYDHDGLIGVGDLSRYLGERVPALTGGAQRPEVETRGSDIRILARL